MVFGFVVAVVMVCNQKTDVFYVAI